MGFEMRYGVKSEKKDCCFDKRDLSSKHSKSDAQNNMVEDHVGFSHEVAFTHRKLVGAEVNGVKNKTVNDNEIQSSLRNEISQLEERLQDQFVMRGALEKALGYKTVTLDASNDHMMPKPTKELIREISVLELEVMYLERYLLSLYRKAYDQQVFAFSPPRRGMKETASFSRHNVCNSFSGEEMRTPPHKSKPDMHDGYPRSLASNTREKPTEPTKTKANSSTKSFTSCPEMLSSPGIHRSRSELSQRAVCSAMATLHNATFSGFSTNQSGPGIFRSHSALSQQAVCSALLSSLDECIDKSALIGHSEPLSFVEEGRSVTSHVTSLAEFLGTRIADHIPETPNRLAEDMVRCMGSMYCKLVEPPLVYPGASSSPTSSFSSLSAISPQYVADMWSPGCKKEMSFDSRLENPFRLEGLKEFSGPYNSLIEVASICTDTQRLHDVEDLLKTFKMLVQRLEKVYPKKMRHEEKLAFWINVHNALVMHAYVEYGIPQNYLKRDAMLQKATCRIGGRVLNPNTIKTCILSHRNQYQGQWVRALLSPKLKLRGRDDWQAYAIDHAEPLLHFALCSGSHSDPAVRIYNPKRVHKMLEMAKEEYIRAAISIRKEEKILMPKLLECYARELNLTSAEILSMVQRHLPETLKIAIRRCQVGRSHKCIEWVPHKYDFRYLLSRELNGPLLD